MADYLPPVVAEIILRTQGVAAGAAETKASLDEIDDKLQSTVKVAQDSSAKMVTSSKAAADAAREQAAAMGASADEQIAASGRAAAAYTRSQAEMTTSQRAASSAARDAAAVMGLGATEQAAAGEKAAKAAEESGGRIGTAFESGTSRAGGAVSKFSSLLGGIGVPMAGSLDKVGTSLDDVESKSGKLTDAMAGLGKVAVVGGLAGFAAAAYEGVKAAQAFQVSLGQIGAGSSEKNAKAIGNAFLDTAGKSAFSAQEMASAFASVSDQLKTTEGQALNAAQATKVMGAASNLAEGAQTSLATATSSVAQVMQAYHLSTAQASQASDTLYSVSRATASPISAIATAVSRLHARLGDLAPSLSDVGGLMLAASQHGLTGSRGIMSMSSALTTLAGGSKATDSTLTALGVSIYNQQGKFIGLQGVIGELHDKLGNLGQAQQEFAAKSLFGASAANTMLQIIKQGPDAFNKDAEAAAHAGAAHAAAQAQSQTLTHQIDVLKASVDDIAVHLGQILIPKLEEMASVLNSVIGWFEKNQGAAEALGAVIGGVLSVAVATFAAQKASSFISSVGEMGQGMATLAGNVAKGAVSIATKLFQVGSSSQAMATETTASTGEVEAATSGMALKVGASADAAGTQMALFATDTEVAGTAVVEAADTTAAGVDVAIGSTGIGLVLIGVSTAVVLLATHWSTAMSAMKSAVQTMAAGATTILNGLISVFNSTIGQITGDIGKLSTATSSGQALVSGMANQSAQGFMNAPLGATVNPATGKVETTGAVPVPTTGSNAQRIAGALKGQGFSNVAIAGILGNFAQETGGGTLGGINTADSGTGASGMGGMGIANWTGTRRVAEIGYAQSHHESATSLTAQVGYLVQELRTSKHGAYTAISGATSASQAAQLFNQLFEGGTDPGGIREKAAQQAMGLVAGTKSIGVSGAGSAAANATLAALMKATAAGTTTATKAAKVTYGPGQNVQSMLNLAQQLVGAPYSRAGHASAYDETVAQIKQFGTDCSGLVSVLLKEGVSGIKAAQNTQGLPTNAGLAAGAGKYVTVYDRPGPITPNSHSLIEILGKYFESGGNKTYNPSGGVAQLTTAQAAGELAGGGFQAFHPTAAALNTAVKGAKPLSATLTAAAINASLQTSINNFIASIDKAATTLTSRYGSLEQGGTARSLESALGVSTSGQVTTTPGPKRGYAGFQQTEQLSTALHAAIEKMGGGASLAEISQRLTPLTTQGATGAGNTQYTAALAGLQSTGQTQMADKLVSAHKAALATLAQQLYALQVTKDAESLTLQATQEKDQTTQASNLASAQLAISQATAGAQHDAAAAMVTTAQAVATAAQNSASAQVSAAKDANQLIVDAMTAAATQITDTTAVISARFSMMATAVQDATQTMADTSSAIVTGIQDQTAIKVDLLGEQGLYGLNLIAQQLQVQMDQMKAGFDQQIAVAQANVDATKQTWDAAIATATEMVAQTQLAQDALVAQAQQNSDTAQLVGDSQVAAAQANADQTAINGTLTTAAAQANDDQTKIAAAQYVATAQAKVDSVTLGADIKVQLAQAVVDLSATAPQAQQHVAQASLQAATASAAVQEAAANKNLSAVSSLTAAAQSIADTTYQTAQDTAAGANQTAAGGLQAAQATAAAAEQTASGVYSATQAQAAQAEAAAQQALSNAQGQGAVAEANAQQLLQSIQDSAAQQEGLLQQQISVTQAEAEAIQRGGGTFNPYSSLIEAAGGGLTLANGGAQLPWEQGGTGGAGGSSTSVVQNITLESQADPQQLAVELQWLLQPHLTSMPSPGAA